MEPADGMTEEEELEKACDAVGWCNVCKGWEEEA